MDKLILAKFISKEDFYEGKRILLDFMENFEREDCIFVGNTFSGFVPLVSENHFDEKYRARTFRFNAGALHQYILVSETETRYLDELVPGDQVLVRTNGEYRQFHIARIKKEIRPFAKLKFSADNVTVESIVQSNATVSVLTDAGIKPIDALKQGDLSYVLKWGRASHLGNSKEEFCDEM